MAWLSTLLEPAEPPSDDILFADAFSISSRPTIEEYDTASPVSRSLPGY